MARFREFMGRFPTREEFHKAFETALAVKRNAQADKLDEMDANKLIRIAALAIEFPDINVEVLPSYNDMLFLYRIGAANWDLWAGSYATI